MIVEYIIHSGIRKYAKLACNSLNMIPNDSFSANQTRDDRSAFAGHKALN